MNQPLLEAKHVSKHYNGVEALGDANIVVHPGEVVALLGGNGAGKSTFIKILAGAQRRDGGEIWFEGNPVDFHSPHEARDCGLETVYQDLAVADNLDVTANLFLGREEVRRSGWPTLRHRHMRAEAQRILDSLGVVGVPMDEQLNRLSGGQRQIVSISRAAAWGSKLVILDEPTAALGVRETKQVLDFVRRLKENGTGVIWISHSMQQVVDYADSVVIMYHGKTVCSMPAGEASVDDLSKIIISGVAPMAGAAAQE